MFKIKWPMMDAAGEGDGSAGGATPPVTPPSVPPAEPTSAPPAPPEVPPVAGTHPPEPPVTPAKPPAPSWDDGWREKIAGTDEKLLKRLERYPSVKAATDALIEAQTKIRSGEVKFTLKDSATPEEIATWRKDNGIPEDRK